MKKLNLSKVWKQKRDVYTLKDLEDPFSIFIPRLELCDLIYTTMSQKLKDHDSFFNVKAAFEVMRRADLSEKDNETFKRMYNDGLVDTSEYCRELERILKNSGSGNYSICMDSSIFNKERRFLIVVELLPEE